MHRTALGRGRALLRKSLQSQTLAEQLQVATHNVKLVKQYYHRDSVVRMPALRDRFLDQLYYLTPISFELSNTMCLDEAWPTFHQKRFDETTTAVAVSSTPRSLDDSIALSAATSRTASIGDFSFDLSSVLSAEHEKQLESYVCEVDKLRSENARLRTERNAALEVCCAIRPLVAVVSFSCNLCMYLCRKSARLKMFGTNW